MRWKTGFIWFLLSPISYEGLVGFLVFMLILVALTLWGIYQLAQLLLPALLLAVLALVAVSIPYHYWSRFTIEQRASRRIQQCLEAVRFLERVHAPREKVVPMEERVREAAQAWSDRLFQRLRNPTYEDATMSHRQLERQLESLSLGYSVQPSLNRWDRFCRLHLERDWIRWLVNNPGAARLWLLGGVASLTVGVASVLPR